MGDIKLVEIGTAGARVFLRRPIKSGDDRLPAAGGQRRLAGGDHGIGTVELTEPDIIATDRNDEITARGEFTQEPRELHRSAAAPAVGPQHHRQSASDDGWMIERVGAGRLGSSTRVAGMGPVPAKGVLRQAVKLRSTIARPSIRWA